MSEPYRNLSPYRHIHFIGIGGVSMSALASTLAGWGFRISGSDRSDSATLQELRDRGIETQIGQRAENINGADLVVYTTAIREDNPELKAARAAGCPVWHRSELLAAVLGSQRRIAVAGTHGKSSTTSMIATVLAELGQDPTLFVGGTSRNFGSNYHLGNGKIAVFEACESDGSFLHYGGCSQVITSIEPDHLDVHETFEKLVQCFCDFAASADPEGFLVHAAGHPAVERAAACSPARLVTYGLGHAADYMARDVRPDGDGVLFTPTVRGEPLEPVRLPVIGAHNIRNALAALAVATELGLDPRQAALALTSYKGVERRFEQLGTVAGYDVIDDYAHHPTEVRATLKAARKHYGPRLLVIFQPHLYSRTRDLLAEFARAFRDARVVVIADIYAAREQPGDGGGISGADLARVIQERQPGKQVVYLPSFEEIQRFVQETARPGDLVLTMGAGDIRRLGETLIRDAAVKA
ncbi:MAG: UDP-N-acetylmuramate--L-alanine ligase [candidate division WS1 bacterium]|nr:UDP-N-acetylmuramate--L-alanine ligase [candidate division WS1 bacterium]